jgi:glutathione S-transferase
MVATPTEKGQGIPDSSAILEYLDENVTQIWPKQAQLRINARVASNLCTGILTAAVKEFLNQNTKSPFNNFTESNTEVIQRTLLFLAKHYRENGLYDEKSAPTQAAFDLAIALSYLDFRLKEKMVWRKIVPGFESLFNQMMELEAFQKTQPSL